MMAGAAMPAPTKPFAAQVAQGESELQQLADEKKKRAAAALAAITPLQGPTDDLRPKARPYTKRTPYAVQ